MTLTGSELVYDFQALLHTHYFHKNGDAVGTIGMTSMIWSCNDLFYNFWRPAHLCFWFTQICLIQSCPAFCNGLSLLFVLLQKREAPAGVSGKR